MIDSFVAQSSKTQPATVPAMKAGTNMSSSIAISFVHQVLRE